MKVKILIFCLSVLFFADAFAQVAARARPRSSVSSSAAVLAVNSKEVSSVQETATDELENVTDIDVEDKSATFSAQFGATSSSSGTGTETQLQKVVREQREAMANIAKAGQQSKITNASKAAAIKNTATECDNSLRVCMSKKCGDDDFSKCANDADIDWGDKMESCKRDSKCTTEEFVALAPEIKSDRDQAARLAGFNEVINCGRTYNTCIRDACGNSDYSSCIAHGGTPASCKSSANSYQKCWAKSGGDSAILACESQYKKCQESDSGLTSRAMEMFADMRVELEKDILDWEKQLYDMRDSMVDMCRVSNGILDDRSLKCVYTVNLFADNEGERTQFASRKMNGDSSYTCNPDEFGIDITTFKENAYRLTRSQTGASSAMLGAGAGTAVGAFTSGAIGRALETAKAKGALKDAQKGAQVSDTKSNIEVPKAEEKVPVPVAEIVEEGPRAEEASVVAEDDSGPEIPAVVAAAPAVSASDLARRAGGEKAQADKDAAAAAEKARQEQLAAERKLAEDQAAKAAAEKVRQEQEKQKELCLGNMLGTWNDNGTCECKTEQHKVSVNGGKSCGCSSGYSDAGNGSCKITEAEVRRLCGRSYDQNKNCASKYSNKLDGLGLAGTQMCTEFVKGCISSEEYNNINKKVQGFDAVRTDRTTGLELVSTDRAKPKTDYSGVLNGL